MLPWLGPWGTGQEEAPEEPGLSPGSAQAWSSGEEAAEEREPPAAGSPPPQALSPRQAGRKPPPQGHLAAEQSAEAAGPHPPQLLSQVPPSRMTPLPRWGPGHQADAGPQLLGPSCGPGWPLSSRTLYHPSWPMYDACGRVPTPGHPEEEQVCADSGIPARSCEDVFCLDPLLPCGQRVALYLAKPPQQAGAARRLLLPPPIMSAAVHASSYQACASTWLSEAEVIALAGLLRMSQGEAAASPLSPAGCPDPGSVSEDTGPGGGQSCSGSTDPCLTLSPDNHCV